MSVGYVDDDQISHYDSNTMRAEPKQIWMKENTDQQYWEGQTGISLNNQQVHKVDIEIVKQRFNQTGGLLMFLFLLMT